MAIHKPLVDWYGPGGKSGRPAAEPNWRWRSLGVHMEQGASSPDNVEFVSADVTSPRILTRLYHGRDAVIVCLPLPSHPRGSSGGTCKRDPLF